MYKKWLFRQNEEYNNNEMFLNNENIQSNYQEKEDLTSIEKNNRAFLE